MYNVHCIIVVLLHVLYRSCTDKLQLTHEQVRIIKHDVKSGEIIKIVAFAGKTDKKCSNNFILVKWSKNAQKVKSKALMSQLVNMKQPLDSTLSYVFSSSPPPRPPPPALCVEKTGPQDNFDNF